MDELQPLEGYFQRYNTIIGQISVHDAIIAAEVVKKEPLLLALNDAYTEIDEQLKLRGMERGVLENYRYAYSTSTETVVTDEDELPEEYWATKEYPDKTKIKNAIASGTSVPGAYLNKKKNLTLKQLEV